MTTEQLLMMFIYDAYNTATGKPSKPTVLGMMQYVADDKVLSQKINTGLKKVILSHTSEPKE